MREVQTSTHVSMHVTNPAREEHRNSCTRHELLDVGSKLYIHL